MAESEGITEQFKATMKCNWLDEDNKWKFTLENSNTNGKLIILEELISRKLIKK